MQTSVPVTAADQAPETRQKVATHIRDAAKATGVPFEFLLAQANQESRLNPEAKSPRSSAQGLFQFTAGTWLDMVKKHGAEHGLGDYAEMIVKGPDGRLTVKDKDLKKDILDLRKDPKLSALMAGEYAKDNEKVLEKKLGREVSTQDLYLAHFLGAGGALKVLQGLQQDGGHGPELAGAAQANPDVFHDSESGEARSLAAIYKTVERRFRSAMAAVAPVARTVKNQLDLAELRPEARPVETTAVAAVTPAPAPPQPLGHFPTAIPDRAGLIPASFQPDSQPFPVKLPPPLAGARADHLTMRGVIAAQEDKG